MPRSKLGDKITAGKKPGPKPQQGPPTLSRPPVGMVWVYNRLSKPYSVTFNGNEEAWGAHEYRMVHQDLAKHVERKAIYKLDPMGLNNVMALAVDGVKGFGEPLPANVEKRGAELLMRDGTICPKDVTVIDVED